MNEPEGLRARPHFRGLPVPFTVLVAPDGTPDFKTLDTGAHARALRERRCGLCGFKMGREVAFVGGPLSTTTRSYRDAPMHVECAQYAFTTCPFLAGKKGYSAVGAAAESVVSSVRPERMAIYITASFRAATAPTGEVVIVAGPPIRIEWIEQEKR